MKGFVPVIIDYLKLVELMEDSRNFFCFETENGRRMIIKAEGGKKCIAIDRNFRAVSFCNDSDLSFYGSPLELVVSYFRHNSVAIDDILITLDKTEAYHYLQYSEEVSTNA